jgi:hypothetical protein
MCNAFMVARTPLIAPAAVTKQHFGSGDRIWDGFGSNLGKNIQILFCYGNLGASITIHSYLEDRLTLYSVHRFVENMIEIRLMQWFHCRF